jgi:hypothetical protein
LWVAGVAYAVGKEKREASCVRAWRRRLCGCAVELRVGV